MATATRASQPTQPVEIAGRPSSPGRAAMWRALFYFILILVAAIEFTPFIYAVATSFKTNAEAFADPLRLLPANPSLEGYEMMTSAQANVPLWTVNSAVVAALITVGQVIFNALAGYALARMNFPGRQAIFLIMLGTLMVPGVVLMIPMFIVLKQLNMLDTYLALIVPGLTTVFGVFLMKQFFEAIPQELEEAAFVDGASRWDIFWRVVLPTAGPALAAMAIFAFQGSWNDFMGPLIKVNSPQLYTLPLGLALLRGSQGTNLPWNFIMAGSILTTLPMGLLFLFFQRYFIEGISYTGIKG